MDDATMLRMIQVGTVSAVDETRHMALVMHQGTGITSGWLYVLQHYEADVHVEPDNYHNHAGAVPYEPMHHHPGSYLEYWMPKVGETVLCAYIPVMDGDGFVLGRIG